MLAVSIPGNLTTPPQASGDTSTSLAVSQGASPFAALFQTNVQMSNVTGNPPVSGAAKDSPQAPDTPTAYGSSEDSNAGCPLNVPFFLNLSEAPLSRFLSAGQPSMKESTPPGQSCAPANASSSRRRVSVASISPTFLPSSPPVLQGSPAPAWSFSNLASPPTNPQQVPSANSVPLASNEPAPAPAPSLSPLNSDLLLAPAGEPVSPPAQPLSDATNSPFDQPKAEIPSVETGKTLNNTLSLSSAMDAVPSSLSPEPIRTFDSAETADAASSSATDISTSSEDDPNSQSSASVMRNLNGRNQHASNVLLTPAPAGVPASAIRTLPGAHAGMEFLRVQTEGAAQQEAGTSLLSPKLGADGEAAKGNARVALDTAPTKSTASVQAPVINIPMPGAAFRDVSQAQQVGGAQTAPAANVSASPRPNSKDTPGGSGGNDDAKSDRSLGTAAARADGGGFSQAIDTAGSIPAGAHTGASVPSSLPVDPRAAAEASAASADTKPAASGSAQPGDAQRLPVTVAADQPVVSGAQVTGHLGQAEIHIEMQAGSLGAVDLRAHVSGDQVGASIAVEHHDAQLMLTNDLPSLHMALTEKNLRVNTLSVSQGMAASTGNGFGSSGGQKDASPSHQRATYTTEPELPAPSEVQEGPLEASQPGEQLSVLA